MAAMCRISEGFVMITMTIPRKPLTPYAFPAPHRHLRSTVAAFPLAAAKCCSGKAMCASTTPAPVTTEHIRRAATHCPPVWDYDSVQSMRSDYKEGKHKERISELKISVKVMLNETMEEQAQLELIDNLQRLGIAYHFEDQIRGILGTIYCNVNGSCDFNDSNQDLYTVALVFRILRQHGYNISQGLFDNFKDENGNLKPSVFEDTKGLLYLYEALFFSIEGETNLDLMREQTRKILKENLVRKNIDLNLALIVEHALDAPLHWRVPRLEARWFINLFEGLPDKDPILLEFAKLDFNFVQAIYQDDVNYASRWWRNLCLEKKLYFAREGIMQNFFWTVGLCFQPQYSYCRRYITQVTSLVTIIDDIYDVYGTLNELQIFTDVIERWDIDAVKELPDYMQVCFMALDKFVNVMDFDFHEKHGFHIVSHLRKAWRDLLRAYWKEAQWYHNGYTPTLKEYNDNAWISVGVPVVLVHVFFLSTINSTARDALESIHNFKNIIYHSSLVFRIADDLGTSREELKRGDVSKSIQCYMNETGATEEDAREHLMFLIGEKWKAMNGETRRETQLSSTTFIEMAMNLGRTAQCIYRYGDGFCGQTDEINQLISSVVVHPIPISN